MKQLEKEIDRLAENHTLEHLAIRIGKGENILYDTFRGNVTTQTVFDIASVTKILCTTTLALLAIDTGLLSLDDSVNRFFKTNKALTVHHLLTHTMGIGFKLFNTEGCTYDNIAEKILEIPSDFPPGSDTVYSCPGFILLGKILEKIYGKRLDECFSEKVAAPLGLQHTTFLPTKKQQIVNANLTEDLRGIVNDRNCQFLGGVAGNAGLFSNLTDMTAYVQLLLHSGSPLFSKETFALAAQNHTRNMSASRGLGFLYVDERYAQTGGLFETGAIGHCGHTGQSVFADYRSGFYVIILSDATINTQKKYDVVKYTDVTTMRERLHAAIKEDLKTE